jgi:hypothetical protein
MRKQIPNATCTAAIRNDRLAQIAVIARRRGKWVKALAVVICGFAGSKIGDAWTVGLRKADLPEFPGPHRCLECFAYA